MSYQALARKYRPQQFSEVIGQQQALKALSVALDHNKLHHAYLLTGTRGVGKTTIARILAKSMNCEAGISSTPCGQCRACRDIVEGRFVDLIEVDAASRTKVEDTRELLENVQYAPTYGRFKVYLIDEVHMLSMHSFNALLKTLEEPPEHVKFLLATTDIQKLPVTVLSRCLQFALKNMTPDDIVRHLQSVLIQEKIAYDTEALWLIARYADGSMRDALSLTDQAISQGEGSINTQDIVDMLGCLDRGKVMSLTQALLNEDSSSILALLDQLSAQNTDYEQVLADLLEVFHRVALQQWSNYLSTASDPEAQWLCGVAAQTPVERIQLFYQVLLIARRDLCLSTNARQGFEMALLRAISFKPTSVPIIESDSSSFGGTLVQAATDESLDSKKSDAVSHRQQSINQLKAHLYSSKTGDVSKPNDRSSSYLHSAGIHSNAVHTNNTYSRHEVSPSVLPNLETLSSENTDKTSLHSDQVESRSDLSSNPADSSIVVESNSVFGSALSSESTLSRHDQKIQDLNQDPINLWPEWFGRLKIEGLTKSLFEQAALVSIDAGVWWFEIDATNSQWLNDSHISHLKQAITSLIAEISVAEGQSGGKAIVEKVGIKEARPSRQTPLEYESKRTAEKHKLAEHGLINDPLVKQILENFDAQIVPGSLKPA